MLFCTDKICKEEDNENVVGISPTSLLSLRRHSERESEEPRLGGMGPEKLFTWSQRVLREGMVPTTWIGPERAPGRP